MSEEVNKSLEIETRPEEPSNSNQSQETKNPSLIFSVIFYLIAAVFLIVGLVLAYQDSNYETEIVGGDAYNYIIFTTRGIVWVGCAICSSIVGLACQLVDFKTELLENN